MPPLANRLPVYILKELSKSCPHTLHEVTSWMDQCGFWLEELNQHALTPDQVACMIGLLGLAVSREAGWPVHTATAELRNYMRLYQIRKEVL